jgi:3',5'-cyclic AMP phosphodiesterase CpdA
MIKLQIAVISDLHCHHSSAGPAETMLLTDADRFPSSQHPVESLLDLIKKEKLQAKVLLMPGDIANKVDKQGIISGWGFVGEIAKALNVETLAPTLGNHDVNSRKPEEDPFKIVKGLGPKFPTSDDMAHNHFWANGFCILEGDIYRILIVNSVMSHLNEDAAKRGFITTQQLASIEQALSATSPKQFQFAVCHHHPMAHEDIGLGTDDLMVNGSLLTQMLSEKGFHLLVHGHKHHPKLSYAPGAVLPVLAAGSFSAGMKNGLASRTRNVFHSICIEFCDQTKATRGTILTWQFYAMTIE